MKPEAVAGPARSEPVHHDPARGGAAADDAAPGGLSASAEAECLEASSACALGGPVGYSVARVSRLYRMAAGKTLRALGLYPGQEFVMLHLWRSGPVRQGDLIKTADLDPSTVTKMLQRLEQAGHVRRRPDPADRRAVLVEATEESCGLRSAVEASLASLEQHTLAGLGEEERGELLRLLSKVEANLYAQTADCPGLP
ncbi:MarR family winged helix-turn-helix transcriptional regulator [Streptomyces sp. NPDC004609]|uniref:MarR family winged helix-turn-helix transcriptional regulator n=1 Tax=Streptomyces sp. NPDC004609 TaxID=3364704 RepID=UPI0036791A3F